MTTNTTMTAKDPFTDIDAGGPFATPAEPPADTQLAKLHAHEVVIQRIEALATLTIEADGEKTVEAARKSAKGVRCEIENCRKSLTADALDWQRRVNDLARRLTARVELVERLMEWQLDDAKAAKAAEIRRQQNELHMGRLAQLHKQHGEWGVSELRATLPLSLVGYTSESWDNMLDVVLPQRKREQELAAKQRAAAEAAAAKLREEEAERQRLAREEREARERDAHHERERQRVAEIARRDEEARIAREQSKAMLEQRRRDHEAAEDARMNSDEYLVSLATCGVVAVRLHECWQECQPNCSEDVRNKLQATLKETIARVRQIFEVDRRPFVSG